MVMRESGILDSHTFFGWWWWGVGNGAPGLDIGRVPDQCAARGTQDVVTVTLGLVMGQCRSSPTGLLNLRA